MKRYRILLLGIALFLLMGGFSCARIFPPAGPPVGPKPAPVVQPPPPPHGSAAPGDCLACHSADEKFVASLQAGHPIPIPPGFKGSPQEACQLCHTMGKGHVPARTMPHPVMGQEGCLACHAGGMPGITRTPLNHSSYTVEKCALCHAPTQTQPLPSRPDVASSTEASGITDSGPGR